MAAAAERHVRERIADLALDTEMGLVTLQSDSGDVAFHLVEEAEAIVLVGQLLAQGERQLSYATAVCQMRSWGAPEMRDAAQRLEDVGRIFSASDTKLVTEFLSTLSPTRRPPYVPEQLNPVAGPISIPPYEASPLLPSRAGWAHPDRLFAVGWFLLILVGGVAVAARRPRWRPALFRIGAVLMTPLLLAVIEVALGLAGVQPLATVRPTFNPTNAPVSHFGPQDLDETPHHVTESSVTRFAAVPAVKGPSELRIVALGASTVHGSNYLAEEAWPAVAGARLQEQLPDHQVRVINLGTGGAVSDEVFFYAREALALLTPDLLMVSLGYNDFTHLRSLSGYRAYEAWDLQLRFELDRWRFIRVLSDALPRVALPVEPNGAFLDPSEMSEADLAAVRGVAASSMQSNLERITALARAADVEVLFLMQGQNERVCGVGSVVGSEVEKCFPPEQRAAMRAAGNRDAVPIVDSAVALRKHAGDGVVGYQYYWDRIHPSRLGHAVLGEAVAPEAARLLRRR